MIRGSAFTYVLEVCGVVGGPIRSDGTATLDCIAVKRVVGIETVGRIGIGSSTAVELSTGGKSGVRSGGS
jgi:hypothetical protein